MLLLFLEPNSLFVMSKLSNLIIKTDNYSFLDSQPHIHFKYYEQVIRNASPSSFNQSGCLNILISLIHKAICVILLNKCMTIFEFRTKKKKLDLVMCRTNGNLR